MDPIFVKRAFGGLKAFFYFHFHPITILLVNVVFISLFFGRKNCDSLQQYLETTMGPISQSFNSKRISVNIVHDNRFK